ncbi:MAG: choice-of-anchor D domain-containing protein [Deltaproteobacteria bacterium]|nr:choice-of-anchor D domain-containing protein [Deltaproteobacteria bacterium]
MRSLTLLLLAGCADYGFYQPKDDDPIILPHLVVEPEVLRFEPQRPGASETLTVTLSNQGDAGLRLYGVERLGSLAFTPMAPEFPQDLAPGASLQVPVRFEAVNLEHDGTLLIESDDPEHPSLEVPVLGEGLIPRLLVAPASGDFGPTGVGCEGHRSYSLTSVGNTAVTVDALVNTGLGFSLTGPSFPLVLQPDDARTFTVRFEPTVAGSHSGRVWVSSDDPADDDSVFLTGQGVVPGEVRESFLQGPVTGNADIFLYVDRSGSMGDDIDNLLANIMAFSDTLSALDSDWQLMVATRDSGCHNGAFINAETEDLYEAFYAALDGNAGMLTESGLSIARNALDLTALGECNEGFLRPGAHTSVILVSDEPEQSRSPWSSLVGQMEEAAPGLSISAVAGPVPDGCATAAPGTGYYQATLATGGTFLSICEEDWGTRLEQLASASTGRQSFFPLTQAPDPESISVYLDGTELLEGWRYVPSLQAVRLDDPPEVGQTVEVRYLWEGECG